MWYSNEGKSRVSRELIVRLVENRGEVHLEGYHRELKENP